MRELANNKPDIDVEWRDASKIPITAVSGSGLTADEKVNFLVTPSDQSAVGSVRLALTGPQNVSRVDNTAPYSLFDDVAGSAFPAGSYQLSATAYPEADGSGTPVVTRTASFTLASDTTNPSVFVTCGDRPPSLTSNGRRVNLRVRVSEPHVGFNVADDLAVSNGFVLAVASGNPWRNAPYDLSVTLRDDVTGGISAMYPAGAVHDEPGNPNTTSDPLHIAQNRTLSAAGASAARSAGANVEFVVTLDARNDCETVTVNYATVDGTATAGEDYTSVTGALTFSESETVKTVRVPVLENAEAEGAETFTLRLSSPSGATLVDAEATGTITITGTEPALPVVSVVAVASPVAEGTSADFKMSRTGPTTEELLVSATWAYSNRTETTTTSFRFQAGVRTMKPGSRRWDDKVVRADWIVTLTLEDGHGYTVSEEAGSATVVVEDNDAAEFALSLDPVEIAEGESATVRVEIVNEVTFARKQTIALDFDGNTAAKGTDYTVSAESLTLGAGAISAEATVTALGDTDDEDDEMVSVAARHEGETIGTGTLTIADVDTPAAPRGALTASFADVPSSHDGETAVTFELRFSESVEGLSYRTLRDEAFEVDGGAVRNARRLNPRVNGKVDNQRWEIKVEPASRGAVTIRLPAGAVQTADGRQLQDTVSATVEGPPSEPLTASFRDVPSSHDGETAFTFELRFSESVEGLSYRTLRDEAIDVNGGAVRKARRLNPRVNGKVDNQRWEIEVDPASHGAVTVRLPAGAVETPDGRQMESTVSATVAGPVGVSVADDRVDEGAGAVLAFAVTLSRAASGTVRVDYATRDGSAQSRVDYTAASGTLTFEAGESSRTVEVTVLDDAHDEGEETLTLVLSNAAGGRLSDGEATGTIVNSDPLPRALLARVGRTAAVHVVEHVEERIAAPREPGFRGELAGRELRRGMERDIALSFLNQLGGLAGNPAGMGGHGPLAGSPAAGAASFGAPAIGGGALMAAASGPGAGVGGMAGAAALLGTPGIGAAGPMGAAAGPGGGLNRGGLLQMGLGGGDPLTGSAFAMNRESHGGILSFWSRGAQSRFTGREGTLGLNGDVRTTMFGADYAKGPLVTGLSLSHSRGLGEYSGVAGGQVLSSVTGLYPWLGYKATDRVTVWGVAGYGAGGMLLTPDGGPALESGLSMAMAAAGTRGELIAGGSGGFELAFKADALWVGTSVDGVDGPAGRLAATEAAVTRFRTGLEGSRGYTLAGRLSLRPSVEVGLRRDGGHAETGTGMDVGGGLVVSDSSTGLSVDVRVRMLVVHEAEGFSERGMAVSLSYNPRPSTPLGFAARMAPSWGGEARSGAEALWGRETMGGMAHGSLAQGNWLDGEVGYGLPLGSRFVGTPRVGFSASEYGRDYRVGYGLGVLDRESLNFELGVDAQRRESPMLGGTSNGVLGRASLGW